MRNPEQSKGVGCRAIDIRSCLQVHLQDWFHGRFTFPVPVSNTRSGLLLIFSPQLLHCSFGRPQNPLAAPGPSFSTLRDPIQRLQAA